MEEQFLQLAADNPGMLCSEAPVEILEAAASDAEPTKFMEEFFAAGHKEWLAKKHGRRLHLPQERINRAVIVLWLRACLLNTSRLLGRTDPAATNPFFSDEGLY